MSGGGSSDCINIYFSSQSIDQIDFGDNEDGILMSEQTEDNVDEETNNKDGNTAQSENDLNKKADNEDGVLSAEFTGNTEGTIVNENCEEAASETGGARRRVVREDSTSTEEQRRDLAVSKQVQKRGRMPRPNSFIKIKVESDSEWVKAKVLSFQSKRTEEIKIGSMYI